MEMLGKIIELLVLNLKKLEPALGVIYDLLQKLAGAKGEEWLKGLDELKLFLRKEIEPLLEFVGSIVVPANTSKFVAKEKFVINTECNAPVKINHLGDDFTKWFLSGTGKTEDPIVVIMLRYAKLRETSVNGPIIAELGGAKKSETTLSEMFSLMEKQGKGKVDVLLNNGCANIFFIRDQDGVLRVISVYWLGDGWRVNAFSVNEPGRWHGGRRVFSRLPVEALVESGNRVESLVVSPWAL